MLQSGAFTRLPKLLGQVLLIFACLCGAQRSLAQAKQTRIACIGNSITAGARLERPDTASYPAVLSALLKDHGYLNYQVRNFGVGGATMLRFGTPNLWKVLDSLKPFVPDIVIIKAGTNETVGKPRYNWDHIGEFEKDYADYLNAIRTINPQCRIILCSPLDMVIQTEGLSAERKNDLTSRRPRIWELRKRIKALAKQQKAFFLDLTKPFEGKADLMTTTDGVHPNQQGYHYIGTLVFEFLSKKHIITQ